MKYYSKLLGTFALLISISFITVSAQTTPPVKKISKYAKKSTKKFGRSPAIYPNRNPQKLQVVYQYVDTNNIDGENQFPAKGNIGIGTKEPQSALEIKRGVGNVKNKNILLQLSNIWAESGQNEPSMMFSNGDNSDPKNTSYWTVGARVSGDNTLNTPQTFKVCFKAPGEDSDQEFFSINSYQGKVKIGNVNELVDGYKLFVDEGILTPKVKVAVNKTDDWFDNVFTPDYKRISLKDLDSFIKKYKHLPDVPTTESVMKEGIDLGKMNGILLKKIEELTLDVIDLKKEIESMKAELNNLKTKK